MVIEHKWESSNFYVVIHSIIFTLMALIFLLQKKGFKKYANNINSFLAKNETNFVNRQGVTFLEIWTENKPSKVLKWYFWYQFLSWFSSLSLASYQLMFYIEKSCDSPFFAYSPLIDWGPTYRWFHAVLDFILFFELMFVAIQADIVIMTFLSFSKSQFVYLKLLLDEEFRKDVRSDENNKTWIETHTEVLNLLIDLKQLLKPHISIKFFAEVIGILSLVLTVTQVSMIRFSIME